MSILHSFFYGHMPAMYVLPAVIFPIACTDVYPFKHMPFKKVSHGSKKEILDPISFLLLEQT